VDSHNLFFSEQVLKPQDNCAGVLFIVFTQLELIKLELAAKILSQNYIYSLKSQPILPVSP